MRRILNGGIFGSMDYDALTGEVYVPDEQHQELNVLSPVEIGVSAIPTEPERVIHMQGTPESVAITSDGLLGFIALREGKVAMLDLIDHRLVYTVDVGGAPHFVITGLYPPPVLDVPTPVSSAISSQQTTIPQMFWLIVFFASLITIIIVTMILVLRLRRSLKAEHRQ